ncbi:MAG: hypothetical protein JCHSAcid_01590 [uncultured Acidilobus sp. JCHS]|nr:MAG: hypothetical protein JCHSAcid_01590 [uncultured Acidilobus sp. JCHS]
MPFIGDIDSFKYSLLNTSTALSLLTFSPDSHADISSFQTPTRASALYLALLLDVGPP